MQKGKGRDYKLDDYIDVAERIRRFYERYPEGSIQTELVRLEGELAVFKATVYRDREDPLPTTGWAYEREGAGFVNQTSFIENCETSAIGRALANMGFAVRAGEPRPSREEMAKAQRMRAEQAQQDGDAATDEQLADIRERMAGRLIREEERARIQRRLDAGMSRTQANAALAWLDSTIARRDQLRASYAAAIERHAPHLDDDARREWERWAAGKDRREWAERDYAEAVRKLEAGEGIPPLDPQPSLVDEPPARPRSPQEAGY